MKKYSVAFLLMLVTLILVFAVSCSDIEDTENTDTDTEGNTAETEVMDSETTSAPISDDTSSEEYESLKYDGTRLNLKHVTAHDPSIVYDPTSGQYYIFGSHRAWATSSDLASWKTFSLPSIDSKYNTLFEESISWSKRGSSNYDVSGNMWAPDVIYNEAMGKWCMYMSINGDNYYSSIVLLTADKINGKYEYVGTIVYSGFTTEKLAQKTDFVDVVGTEKLKQKLSRYVSGTKWNSQYGPNAIDPCVFYDENGDLWMSYGSWFGGIFLLKLDNETGLRDYDTTYRFKQNVSDEYFGYRLSGGYGCTGEGSYIVWDKDAGYYYLYISYGGLNATDSFSGYHIRLFRSENVNGPYVDAMGNNAICTSAGESQAQKGIKLFGNYYFSSLKSNDQNASKGYMSPGHNSAFIDSDGQHYLIYHTRFNLGNEWHAVRVHQQFMNEDGWPVTAVYEHQGSVISDAGYSTEDIVGTYEYVDHGTSYKAEKTGMLKTLTVTLNADGSVSGDVSGSWEQKTGSDGKGYYATFVIGENTYKGVFFKQYNESQKHRETMTFTLIGDNDRSIWGSKVSE